MTFMLTFVTGRPAGPRKKNRTSLLFLTISFAINVSSLFSVDTSIVVVVSMEVIL